MARKKSEIMFRKLNEDFRDELPKAVKDKYGVEVETYYNLFSMTLVTRTTNCSDLTPKQRIFIDAYSAGYNKAMNIVGETP